MENSWFEMHCVGNLRVLIANEPRAYRDTISEVLCELRPDLGIASIQPEHLEEAVSLHEPHVVICSKVLQIVRDAVPIWVELYPGHSSKSNVSIEGHCTEIEGIQLSELLSIVDRAHELAQPG